LLNHFNPAGANCRPDPARRRFATPTVPPAALTIANRFDRAVSSFTLHAHDNDNNRLIKLVFTNPYRWGRYQAC
jgi:hypothetical protein